MQTFTVLAIVAMMAYSATATPCTDICGGQCALEKQACDFSGVFGKLCDTQNHACTQTCAAACGCADSSSAKCGEGYAKCKGDGSNVLNVATCGYNLSVCTAQSQTECSFNLLATAVNSLAAPAAGHAAAPAS